MRTGRTSYRANVLIAVGSVLALLLPVHIAEAQDVSAEHSDSALEPTKPFFPPHSRPFDRSFPEWTAEWWQYVFSIPVPNNPVLDETGTNCAVGQHGPVWFLVGSFSSTPVMRTCSIPQDRALLLPIINQADINVTDQTADELRAETAPCIDSVDKLSVEVDGHSIERLRSFRIKSVPFDIALPPNPVFTLPPVKTSPVYSPLIDDGFYVMLKPLSVGQHTIHILGHRPATPCGEFSQDITYIVTTVEVKLR